MQQGRQRESDLAIDYSGIDAIPLEVRGDVEIVPGESRKGEYAVNVRGDSEEVEVLF